MVIFKNAYLRISLITPRILRTEKGNFTDLPTQTVQNRDFGKVDYTLTEEEKFIFVETERVKFQIRKTDGEVINTYINGEEKGFCNCTFPGTARTLDMANGAVKLEKELSVNMADPFWTIARVLL